LPPSVSRLEHWQLVIVLLSPSSLRALGAPVVKSDWPKIVVEISRRVRYNDTCTNRQVMGVGRSAINNHQSTFAFRATAARRGEDRTGIDELLPTPGSSPLTSASFGTFCEIANSRCFGTNAARKWLGLPSFPLHGHDKTSEFWNGELCFQSTSKPPKLDASPCDQPVAKNLSPWAETCHLRKNTRVFHVAPVAFAKTREISVRCQSPVVSRESSPDS
jgi:hypothetical protein